MPIYKVKCVECNSEDFKKFGMRELHECKCECGGTMKQVITAPKVIVKAGKNDVTALTHENWHDNAGE